MLTLQTHDPRAVMLVRAIQRGDLDTLRFELARTPALATARLVDEGGTGRTLVHVVADWPGHFPEGPATVALLSAAGAPLSAPVQHRPGHGAPETALHWAASSGDVAVLDALLDHGADIEAPGAIFTGGTAMSDAVVFAQWPAARRLRERGATMTIWQAAALGELPRVVECCAATPAPAPRDLANALWHACRGGSLAVATELVARGADLHRVGHDGKTPLDAARESGATPVIEFLLTRGATPGQGHA